MNNLDKQYQSLLRDILDNGLEKEDRTGTGTISVFGRQIRHSMSEGFPALTTKKLAFKTMVTELLWFLRGDSDIRFLWQNNCFIWDGDWYKHYKTTCSSPYSLEQMKKFALTNDTSFHESTWELGPIYGKQWRNWTRRTTRDEKIVNPGVYTEQIDQIQNLINDLKTNPDSRRLMVSAWNVGELNQMVLPPCHYGFQVYTRELSLNERGELFRKTYPGKSVDDFAPGGMEVQSLTHQLNTRYDNANIPTRAISLMFNMRSNDVPLGLPFNIASYGLLLEIFGKMVNMVPDELIANLGDAHIYKNQVDGVKEQLTREPYNLPKLDIHPGVLDYELDKLEVDMFKLIQYQSHPSIKIPLSN